MGSCEIISISSMRLPLILTIIKPHKGLTVHDTILKKHVKRTGRIFVSFTS